jgi:hypothetical protein
MSLPGRNISMGNVTMAARPSRWGNLVERYPDVEFPIQFSARLDRSPPGSRDRHRMR